MKKNQTAEPAPAAGRKRKNGADGWEHVVTIECRWNGSTVVTRTTTSESGLRAWLGALCRSINVIVDNR